MTIPARVAPRAPGGGAARPFFPVPPPVAPPMSSPAPPRFSFTGSPPAPPPGGGYPWAPSGGPAGPAPFHQTLLPPSLAVANAEIAALVDLYQQQLAEITAEHSLLLEDQAKLASFIAPYLDEDGRVVGEFDDTILLFKQGLDLRLLEYEEDCRRIQQTERRLQRTIDDICLRYDSMVVEAQGYAESRLLGQVKDLQRVIWLLHSELDELRFQRDIYADETKRLRGICRFGNWTEDGIGVLDREEPVFSGEGPWQRKGRHVGSIESAQPGMVRWPRASAAESRPARRPEGREASPFVAWRAKASRRGTEARSEEPRTWLQPGERMRDEDDDETARPRGSKAKKREEPSSLFHGVLSKLLFTDDGKEKRETQSTGREVTDSAEAGRRKSTQSGKRSTRLRCAPAVDGVPHRPGPPRAILFKSSREEEAPRRSRAWERRDEEHEEEEGDHTTRRRGTGRVSHLLRRVDDIARDDELERRDRRRSSLRQRERDEDEEVRPRPGFSEGQRGTEGASISVKAVCRRRSSAAGGPGARPSGANVERKRYSEGGTRSEAFGVKPPRGTRSDELTERGEDSGAMLRPAGDKQSNGPSRRSEFAPSRSEEEWKERSVSGDDEQTVSTPVSREDESVISPREETEDAWQRRNSVAGSLFEESEPPSSRDGRDSQRSGRDDEWREDAETERFLESEDDLVPPARSRGKSLDRKTEPVSPAPLPVSPYYYEKDEGSRAPPRRFASRTVVSPLVQSVTPSPQASPRVLSRLQSGAFLGAVGSPLPSARREVHRGTRRSGAERRHRGRSRGSPAASSKFGGPGRSLSRTLASPLASSRSFGGVGLAMGPRRMLSVASRAESRDEDDSVRRGSGSQTFGGDGGSSASSRPPVSPLDLSRVRR
ncbi:hypothetical protein BESB_010920 [Besnoitia besnoiti]|uniref:Uncharacterized protein n=1 Tax=Besnoitia besnoiti TaxID=94643 RepID=A0A2A9MR17_BESBE|nr:hypothetical protein BESB_010920 [Besnoitia besnoiti]PFH38750.1 hypothetical protein BESB_010920 [Besnoitia besnoiti]